MNDTNKKIKNLMRVGLEEEIIDKIPNLKRLISDLYINAINDTIYCIRHYDLDGIGIEVVMKALSMVTGVEVIFYEDNPKADLSFEEVLRNRTPYDFIFIADLSFSSKEYIDKMVNDYIDIDKWLILLDHHHTAQFMNDYDFAFIREHQPKQGIVTSGTLLTFYAFKDILSKKMSYCSYCRLERFVNAVAAYDTYFFKDESELSESLYGSLPNDLNILFKYYNNKKEKQGFIDYIYDTIVNDLDLIDDKSKIIIEIQKDNIEGELTRAYLEAKIISYKKYKFAIYYYTGEYVSEIGNALCNRTYEPIDFALIIDLNKCKVGLRTSRDDLDLTMLIKDIPGAGGHPKACGFSFDSEEIYSVNSYIYSLMNLD